MLYNMRVATMRPRMGKERTNGPGFNIDYTSLMPFNFFFVGNYVLNKITITYVSYGQDLILAVANVQSAVKSLIMIEFNKTFFL